MFEWSIFLICRLKTFSFFFWICANVAVWEQEGGRSSGRWTLSTGWTLNYPHGDATEALCWGKRRSPTCRLHHRGGKCFCLNSAHPQKKKKNPSENISNVRFKFANVSLFFVLFLMRYFVQSFSAVHSCCFTVLPIQAALGSLKASTRKTSRSRFKLFMMSVPL